MNSKTVNKQKKIIFGLAKLITLTRNQLNSILNSMTTYK